MGTTRKQVLAMIHNATRATQRANVNLAVLNKGHQFDYCTSPELANLTDELVR